MLVSAAVKCLLGKSIQTPIPLQLISEKVGEDKAAFQAGVQEEAEKKLERAKATWAQEKSAMEKAKARVEEGFRCG